MRFGNGIERSVDFEPATSEFGALFSEDIVFFMSGERNGVASFLCCNFWDAKVGRFCAGGGGIIVVFVSFFRSQEEKPVRYSTGLGTGTYYAFGCWSFFLLLCSFIGETGRWA